MSDLYTGEYSALLDDLCGFNHNPDLRRFAMKCVDAGIQRGERNCAAVINEARADVDRKQQACREAISLVLEGKRLMDQQRERMAQLEELCTKFKELADARGEAIDRFRAQVEAKS